MWKVELVSSRKGASVESDLDQTPQSGTPVCVRHALRGSVEENMLLGEFLARCEPYSSGSGRIIDQAYQERLPEGMVRCYWVPAMRQLLGIDSESLPVIWDADFLYGPKAATGEDTYVLCEINVSSVYPFPDEALASLARETCTRLQASLRARNA